jgi:uncharacterized protein (TIRG00374 family)
MIARLDMRAAWVVIASTPRAHLIWPLVATLLVLPARPLRWQLLFPAGRRPSLALCFSAVYGGNFLNFLLPGRGGDIVRCWMVTERGQLFEISLAVGTMAAEKLLDMAALLGIALVASALVPMPIWLLRVETGGFCLLLLAGLLLFYLGSMNPIASTPHDRFRRWLTALADGLRQGIAALRSPALVGGLVVMTIAVWAGDALIGWSVARCLGIPLGAVEAAVIIAIVTLATMIPAAPGFIGTYELAALAACRMFGLHDASGLALTLGLHAWAVFLAVASGVPSLAWIAYRSAPAGLPDEGICCTPAKK